MNTTLHHRTRFDRTHTASHLHHHHRRHDDDDHNEDEKMYHKVLESGVQIG